MSDIRISDIRRNTNDFSFVDTLGSFINNYEFKQSFDQFKLSNDNKSSYIWGVLSSIGNEYANTIYENVLNYIDNVANIDLCKVKSLQSMIKVLGIDYDIVNDISKMPVEIVNLIDILSVNKRYLLDSSTFATQFHDILKKYDFGKCIVEAPENDMSAELSGAMKLNDAAMYVNSNDKMLSVQLSDYFIQPGYLDNAQYKLMLVDIFKQLIESNIYMQYADAESQLSSSYTYIYEYIADKLLAKDNIIVETADAYDKQIKSLKIKYRLQGFKQDEVMNAIESGHDYFDRYNQYQQEVLLAERKRRDSTYPYAKTYTQSEDSSEGYSLTRYSWYREQKVLEYFKFVEDTYSSLINAKSNDVESVLKGISNTRIDVYDKDNEYFVIDQTANSSLLYYDKNGSTLIYRIRTTYINTVAELLAQQVLDLADIREQVKIQLRKSYMKGTFLLLSYVINEYLKYDISKNYGNVVYTQDENIPLSSYIDSCIKNNGVQIVEYYDDTEYFNQSNGTELCTQAQLGLSVLNLNKLNAKFYDNEQSKLGQTSQDLPLAEIDQFYRSQLNLKSRDVQTSSDLVNFLSLIYDYGANESFLADRSDDISSKFRLSGEFYCKVWNDKLSAQQWQGDIGAAYDLHESQLSIANVCKEHVDNWKAKGHEEEVASISTQIDALSSFISTWWHDKISADNASLRQQVQQQQKDDLYEVNQTSADMMNISADFDSLYNDLRYETYFKVEYIFEDVLAKPSIKEIIDSFYDVCKATDNTIFKNTKLHDGITSLQREYDDLDEKLSALLNYVKKNWPYYYTQEENEITSQTQSLAAYLQNQLQQLFNENEDANSNKISCINEILNQTALDNLGSGNVWNIKKINNTFSSIKSGFDDLKKTHGSYLSEYADAQIGKLSEQFKDLLDWCATHDKTCQREVLEELDSIVSEYTSLDEAFKKYVNTLKREYVSDIDSSQQYVLASAYFKDDDDNEGFKSELLEKLIINVKSWLDNVLDRYDKSADEEISIAIPETEDFIEEMSILQQTKKLLEENALYSINDELLSDVLSKLADALQEKMDFVESQREHYNIQKEIFLKYNGTAVGYDPFYNFKNVTHSSYQIHPYLYNFVEVNKLEYPLANTFFIAFNEDYEKQLVEMGLDSMIGKYGNITNLSKHGMLDWTGYQSQYERDFSSESDVNLKQLPEQFAYAGAFYPPALEEFLADSPSFIQKVQDNTPDSYYYKLSLSQEELNKISEQLRIYEKPIREIVRCPRDPKQNDKTLSAEYDIYKYAQDIYGNSLILFKSYKHLYKQHEKDEVKYVPSYNDKKNTPGELWMRIKNHPIAFPAFDLRSEYIGLTQYSNTDDATSQHKMNSYVKMANDYFSTESNFSGVVGDTKLADVTRDAIQMCFASVNQHMRCFFDMELTPDKRSLLLVVPMQTGTAAKRGKQDWSTFKYGNTNIIVGQLWQDYDYVKDMNVYAFQTANIKDNVENVTNNVDNIRPTRDLLTTSDVPSTGQTREVTEFVGFAKHSNYIIAVYAYKFWYSQKKYLKSFVSPNSKNAKPLLQLECWCYNGTRKRNVNVTQQLKYDILYKEAEGYEYANTIAIASNNDMMTLCYISDEFQKAYKPRPQSDAQQYTADTTIVNFAEYTNVVDKSSLTAFGENKKYPSDTAILQTTDAQHINIYNSFDSFTSYIVNVDLKFVGSRIVAKQLRHYNLNTDCGYYPLFADVHGKSRLYANSALSSKSEYSFQLLGPENSDIDYTPVILDTNVQEQNGRVTEDYRNYNKLVAFSNQINLKAGEHTCSCVFDLRDVFVDDNGSSTYNDLAETGTLTNYKWNIANTSYTAMPVVRGTLAQAQPTDNYYVSSSKYDTLSGQEMIGPNGVTFQGTTNTNHIDGISAVDAVVDFDEDKLPVSITMTITFDGRYDTSDGAEIPESQFQLLLYAKSSNVTYDYYRVIENAYHGADLATMNVSDADEISFKDIAVLSDFEIDGKFPFRDVSKSAKYKDLSAPYMFKYSEEDPIDREFPLLAASDVNDEVTYLANEDQYIYFFAIDSYDTVDKDIFYMEKYDTLNNAYTKVKVNTISKKYQEFYDKSLTIQTTYNVEQVDDDYGIVLYFNYKNYTSPSYVNFKKRYTIDGKAQPPEWSVCTSTSKGIDHTYLRLSPGKSGRLDIRVDYIEYAKVNAKDLTQSVVGKESRTIRTYYIMNVSDDKPKFVISRQPFK